LKNNLLVVKFKLHNHLGY